MGEAHEHEFDDVRLAHREPERDEIRFQVRPERFSGPDERAAPQDDEAVWKAFMAWFKTALPAACNPLSAYAASLRTVKAPEEEVRHVLKPGQLREIFKGFRLDRYEELEGIAD